MAEFSSITSLNTENDANYAPMHQNAEGAWKPILPKMKVDDLQNDLDLDLGTTLKARPFIFPSCLRFGYGIRGSAFVRGWKTRNRR